MKHYLSKSQYTLGLKCHKALWLLKNKPELKSEPDESKLALFEQGHKVGKVAQELFPGGKEVEFTPENFLQMIERTKALIQAEETTIYEAAFSWDNIFVMVDVLHKGEKGWEIHEVKSSTSVKDVYHDDLAIQMHIVEGAGHPVIKATIIHLNNKYVRQGDLYIEQLFTTVDLTAEAKAKRAKIETRLAEMRSALDGEEPSIDIGPHCLHPYGCDFMEYCWQHVPDYSIFDINNLWEGKKFALYSKGILTLDAVPPEYPLGKNQRIQIDCEMSGKEYIDHEARVFKILCQLTKADIFSEKGELT